MENKYLSYNPVFESLYSQASKYSNNTIYEQTGEKLGLDKVEQYASKIIMEMLSKVSHFGIQSPPIIEKEIKKILGEEIPKLSKNSSLKGLVQAIENLWKNCYDIAQRSSKKDLIMPYYNKINAGMDSLKKSWEGLNTLSGGDVENKDILEAINASVSKLVESIINQLEKNKQILNNSK